VTVADIAERAGLTKRSFFNHFADKREVVFASADDVEASVLAALTEAGSDLDPLDAAVWAFMQAAAPLEDYAEIARGRRALIDSSPELQERGLAASIQGALNDLRAALGSGDRGTTLPEPRSA
jgi:AcrR family transcriptional regulator